MGLEERIPDREEIEKKSDWLWQFLVEHTGEDRFFHLILGRGCLEDAPHPQNGSEIDRLMMFREIVDYLVQLRGSEAEAAKWLFHNPSFEKVARASPFDYLEDGEFQALSLLHDWLQVALVESRRSPGSSEPALCTF